ncbi:hypothetical protein GGS21DRAFT_506790 [Xylaria nigripes]|nr:hypothetical protein GGS21DRAFT_506790 [Xylaria nigripes]
MTDHPYEYGQHYGRYPHASVPPTSGPSNTQPYYTAPQVSATPPIQYMSPQSASAYEYNSNRIPGLGLGGPPTAPTNGSATSFPSGVSQLWPVPAPVPVPGGQARQINAYFPNHQQTPVSLPQQPHLTYQQPHSNSLEEGELSEGEGEFEDLYEPRTYTGASQLAPETKPTKPLNKMDSRTTSVGDSDGSSIYDPHDPHIARGESPTQATSSNLPVAEQEYLPDDEWEPSYPDRDRSGSYSPYLSPREVHRKISVAKSISRDNKAADPIVSSQPTHQTGMPMPTSLIPMVHPDFTSSTSKNQLRSKDPSSPRPFLEGKKATQELKKRAQEAILELWPYKVRFQDYLDEGLDPNVVKHLFKDLGLDVPSSKAASAPTKATNASRSTPSKAVPSLNIAPQPQSPLQKFQAPLPDTKQRNDKAEKDTAIDVNVSAKSAAEERKDKIARKLAAIAQKATSVQPITSVNLEPTTTAPAPSAAAPTIEAAGAPFSTASVPSPAPVSVPVRTEPTVPTGSKSSAVNTPPTAAKTRAENNAILQQKLAALKKQQAQLAADKARVASSESTAASSPVARELTIPDKINNGDLTPKTKSVGSAQQNPNQNPSAELRSNAKDENIPGLSFPSLAFTQPIQGSNRNLKRPVASDFDNFTARFEPPKRSRTEERLIIDVSDDEDVEMDIGSPVDELSPVSDTGAASAPRALTVIPSQSDGPNRRQQASPASSSAPTPPIHGTRIDILHKRIEETKRRIAEAEAKKAAKKATAQNSPKPMSPNTLQQVIIPKANEDDADEKRAIHDRRDRISTYELPRVIAALEEKQDKLKSIVAEAARLELEVQATLDERQKLTVEMECLAESSASSSETEERSPPLATDTYSEMTPPQPPLSITDSSHIGKVADPQFQLILRGDHLDRPTSHSQNPPSTSTDGDMATQMSNDEALQAAILTDNTHSMDLEMTDADVSDPAANNSPIAKEAPTIDGLHRSPENTGPTDLATAEMATVAKQSIEAATINVQADHVAKPALSATSTRSSEPDNGLSGSDISDHPSAPELSQSDDESYEPRPAQVSETHGAQMGKQNSTDVKMYLPFSGENSLTNCQVVDDIVEETISNHTSADQNPQVPEHTANEVNNRFFEEPPLLTTSQDNQGSMPVLESLLPYKSPLSYFRAYRFHPKYFEEVPGGLKSMTFSARIDPMRELCPQVLAGQSCPNGPSCEYQHFDSMILAGELQTTPLLLFFFTMNSLEPAPRWITNFMACAPDADIITQLGSADMFVGETRTKFIEGLKRVLSDLKTNRVKDFDRITKAILKHRQEFLGDQTRVLALDSSII